MFTFAAAICLDITLYCRYLCYAITRLILRERRCRYFMMLNDIRRRFDSAITIGATLLYAFSLRALLNIRHFR